MRLTLALQMPQLRQRLKDASWQRWRKRAIYDLGTAKKLQERGITVVDANEYVQELDRHLYPADWRTLPDAEPIFPEPPMEDRSHPDWQEEPIMMFDSQSFPIEGVKQAQVFTNCIKASGGLPGALLERCQFRKFENFDTAAERIVRQAFIWDAYLEKMPRLRDLDYPTLRLRTVFGIPLKRSNDILIRNFLRLIEPEIPELATSRMISAEEEFRVNLTRHGFSVQLKLSPLMNIMSKKPVASFGNKETAGSEFENDTVPNISPFLSTTNFDDTNIYNPTDYFAVKSTSAFPYVHTSVFSHHIPGSHTHIHPRWNDDRFAGTTIMYGFAVALLMARRIFGKDVSHLPGPVTSQIIHCTGQQLQFAVFQLNTLNLEDLDSKVKNMVWLTDKINLFSRIQNKLGEEVFEGYNPEVLNTIKGIYCSPTQ